VRSSPVRLLMLTSDILRRHRFPMKALELYPLGDPKKSPLPDKERVRAHILTGARRGPA